MVRLGSYRVLPGKAQVSRVSTFGLIRGAPRDTSNHIRVINVHLYNLFDNRVSKG